MRARVSKRFTFEAAHHLPNHDGKCRGPHGHSYTVVVTCEGQIIDDPDNPKDGMVVDFSDLSAFWKRELKPLLDHKDLNETIGVVFSMATTAENIAAFICRSFADGSFPIIEVTVMETTTSSASVTYSEVWANGYQSPQQEVPSS